MEDFPQDEQEEKKPERRKKRKGLASIDWRQILRGQPEKSRKQDADETEKPRFFKKEWWKKIFRDWVAPPEVLGIEKPEPLQANNPQTPLEKEHETHEKFTESISPKIETLTPQATTPEIKPASPEREKPQQSPEIPKVDPEGTLRISHEEEPVVYAEAREKQTISSPPEQIGDIVHRLERRDTGVLFTAEVLSHYRNSKRKREIRKLRQQTKVLGKQQQTIKQEQTGLRFAVEKQLKPELYELKAWQAEQREAIRVAREPIIQKEKVAIPSTMEAPAVPNISTVNPEKLEAFIHPRTLERPETVQHKVEAAAEQNLPIESVYERRHEIKDEPRITVQAAGQQAQGGGGYYAVPLPLPTQRTRYADHGDNSGQMTLPQQIAAGGMYAQAVKNGFWTALALLAIGIFMAMAA